MSLTDPLFYILVLVFSVIVHEIAHGYMADYLGDPTARLAGRLTLNPIPHIDPFGSIILPALLIFANVGAVVGWAKPVPYNPYNLKNQRWGTALVAVSGAALNFLIAVVFGLLIRFDIGGAAFQSISGTVVFLNIVLGVFNLVPVPPLDGAKVLFSLLPARFFHVQEWLERYSLALVLLLVFFFWRLIVPIVYFIFWLITGVSPALF